MLECKTFPQKKFLAYTGGFLSALFPGRLLPLLSLEIVSRIQAAHSEHLVNQFSLVVYLVLLVFRTALEKNCPYHLLCQMIGKVRVFWQ